jgi:hypothetical protein
LCTGNVPKDIDHLFFGCLFSLACWQKLGVHWNMIVEVCERIWEAINGRYTPALFMEFFIMAAWEIC